MNNIISTFLVKEDYDRNIIWGSIDPRNGNIILYPPYISKYIEENFKKEEKQLEIKDYYGITILYENMIQITQNGMRSIFREDLNVDESFVLIDNHTIKKKVLYNNKLKAWYLNKEITHLGFLVDTSGSMHHIYNNLIELGIENFIEEQKNITNNVLFYGSTFSSSTKIIYNHINLNEILDLKDKFYSIKPSGTTACYDSVIMMIDNINKYYSIGDEVVLCIITDGIDNSSSHSKKDMINKITKKKKLGWNIIIMGANNFDVEIIADELSIGRECSINIGNTKEETSNAFRSVSHGINRVRTGQDTSIVFTENERSVSKN